MAVSDAEQRGLAETLRPEHRALYEGGDVVLAPGRDYPVVRWAKGNEQGGHPGALVKGSGVSPNHVDAANSRKSGYKRKRGYWEALELAIPDDLDPEKQYSLGAWLQQAWEAAKGGEVTVPYTCDECGHRGETEAWKKPDVAAVKLIFDRILPAVQRQEISGQFHHILEQLDEVTDVREITVRTKGTKALPPQRPVEGDVIDG